MTNCLLFPVWNGEELAIETLKNGAKDYVLKDNLSRVVPSVRRALNEYEEQIKRKQAEEALQKSEEKYRNLVHEINDGKITGTRGVVREITERKQIEAQMKHMAFHDALTCLPNRTLFYDRLS